MQGKLVLIVQADEEGRKELVEVITSQGGIALQACDAETALALMRVNRPVAVLADLALPGMHGTEFSHRARAAGFDGPLIIIARGEMGENQLTGFVHGGVQLDVHGDDGFQVVAGVIRALLEPADAPHAGSVHCCAGMLLDREAREARNDGRNLDLTRSEFALLERLVDQAGRVVPRNVLLRTLQVHRPPHVEPPSSRAVDQHISHLRTKLAGTELDLEPVYGIGYRLRVQQTDPSVDRSDGEPEDEEVAARW